MPQAAFALQLYWTSGSTNLNFTGATRCTLVVEATPAAILPSEWRLLWVADSSAVEFVPMDSVGACLLEEAQASRIHGPATSADSAANQITALFCSDGNGEATVAWQVVDLSAGGRGRFKAVALDPSDPDSSRVIESSEVTYNGGVVGPYPPVVLHASSVHNSLQLRVTAIGSGLSSAVSMSIAALDSTWSLPLELLSQSDGSVTGVASVAALLPACQATVGAQSGAVSAAALRADDEPASDIPLSCQTQFFEELLQPPPSPHGYTIQPKDFAFTRGFVDESSHRYALHLFYIRHNYWYYPPPPAVQHPEFDEKNIGHIWTTDFNSWFGPCRTGCPNANTCGLNCPDTVALTVRSGKFDEFHVWAPTIVQRGPTFWMFYTGVRVEGGRQHQRIGVATSTDLNTWTPADTVVLSAPKIAWAMKDPSNYPFDPYGGSQQLRDPFVMEDPVNPGQWLMYFVAEDSIRAPKMAVGAARSSDLLNWFPLEHPFSSTERPTFQGATNVVESPHVFARNGQWWMPYTVNLDQIFFETTTSTDPADTMAASWTNPVRMRGVTEGQPSELQYWHASEHLRINSTQYMAAFNDNATSIDIKGVFSPADAAVDSFRLDCPEIAGVGGRDGTRGVLMTISKLRWGAAEVGLHLELPSRMSVQLAVYDIAGRRRATLIDGEVPGGVTEVSWDGRDQVGARVASGIYFVRLAFAGGARLSKIVMLR